MPLFNAHGKMSWFGGPNDTGVSPSEGLAFIFEYSQRPDLFLPQQPPGTTGLARRLNPDMNYIACRWDYNVTPKEMLRGRDRWALVTAVKSRLSVACWPADWGPNQNTGRVADLSPGAMKLLGLKTDDIVDVVYPFEEEISMPKIAMSSGHSKQCQGAVGIINETDENIRVTNRVAELIKTGGGTCATFHSTGKTQSEVLNQQTNWHNKQTRDLDVQIHFNAYQATEKPMGTEVCYVTQSSAATKLSSAIASAGGFINRGAKYRGDLSFLNTTNKPALLAEICFVDSAADCGLYEDGFEQICQAIAYALVPDLEIPGEQPPEAERPERPPVQEERVVDVQIYAPPGVRVDVTVNSDAEGKASRS